MKPVIPYTPGMNPGLLTHEQAAQVRDALRPALGYLHKLRERMTIIGFTLDDRLYQRVLRAADAMQDVTMAFHYKSCKGGVG